MLLGQARCISHALYAKTGHLIVSLLPEGSPMERAAKHAPELEYLVETCPRQAFDLGLEARHSY